MTTYALVYATASGMLRRVITDDDGVVVLGTMPDGVTPAVVCQHQLSHKPNTFFPLVPGETALQVIPASALQPDKPSRWPGLIQAATGFAPSTLGCALIDGTNTVQQVIMADAAIDAAPAGFTMVQCYSTAIQVGCTYDPIGGLFTLPGITLPPGVPGNSTQLPIVVPPAVIPKP